MHGNGRCNLKTIPCEDRFQPPKDDTTTTHAPIEFASRVYNTCALIGAASQVETTRAAIGAVSFACGRRSCQESVASFTRYQDIARLRIPDAGYSPEYRNHTREREQPHQMYSPGCKQ